MKMHIIDLYNCIEFVMMTIQSPINHSINLLKLSKDLSGMRVGVVKEGFRGEEPDVDTKVREAAYKLQAAGALVEDISVPMHIPGIEMNK